jgi:hypothetical protein
MKLRKEKWECRKYRPDEKCGNNVRNQEGNWPLGEIKLEIAVR